MLNVIVFAHNQQKRQKMFSNTAKDEKTETSSNPSDLFTFGDFCREIQAIALPFHKKDWDKDDYLNSGITRSTFSMLYHLLALETAYPVRDNNKADVFFFSGGCVNDAQSTLMFWAPTADNSNPKSITANALIQDINKAYPALCATGLTIEEFYIQLATSGKPNLMLEDRGDLSLTFMRAQREILQDCIAFHERQPEKHALSVIKLNTHALKSFLPKIRRLQRFRLHNESLTTFLPDEQLKRKQHGIHILSLLSSRIFTETLSTLLQDNIKKAQEASKTLPKTMPRELHSLICAYCNYPSDSTFDIPKNVEIFGPYALISFPQPANSITTIQSTILRDYFNALEPDSCKILYDEQIAVETHVLFDPRFLKDMRDTWQMHPEIYAKCQEIIPCVGDLVAAQSKIITSNIFIFGHATTNAVIADDLRRNIDILLEHLMHHGINDKTTIETMISDIKKEQDACDKRYKVSFSLRRFFSETPKEQAGSSASKTCKEISASLSSALAMLEELLKKKFSHTPAATTAAVSLK